jgi:hypothetical protein
MALLKIRNQADDAWIEVGGVLEVIQQDSEPATTYPGQLWLDTDEPTLLGAQISDLDGDTKVQCEESDDEDKVRIDCGGVEALVVQTAAPQLAVQGATTGVIGLKAGTKENSSGIQLFDSDGKLFSFSAFGRDYAGDFGASLQLYNWSSSSYTQSWHATGEVTMPSQPAFYGAGLDVAIENMVDATTYWLYWTEVHDIGDCFETSTFTCPVDGWYQVDASINLTTWDADASFYRLNILSSNDNSYTYYGGGLYGDNETWAQINTSACLYCDANDTIRLWVRQDDAAEITDVFNNASYTWCSIKLVG